MRTLVLLHIAFLLPICIRGHLPSYASTPSSAIDQLCMLAESCLHDTIPVCGQMGDHKRSFLDLCDMLEYACDTTYVYNHIEDTEGCPIFKDKQKGK